MTDVFAFLGRGAFFRAPFRNSISSACRPTIRSNAAILASYSWSRSAACASSSKAPTLILLNPDPDQLPQISIRPAHKGSPSGNELLCDLPFERDAVGTLSGLAFRILLKAALIRFTCLNLSGPKGALQSARR